MADILFQQLYPGKTLVNDWCNHPIPENLVAGENSMIDSSFTFRKFFSKKNPGLKVGNNVTLQKTNLATEEHGYIEIGDYCFISGASIIATESIIIGNNVFIAVGATLVDSDFHPLEAGNRLRDTIAISPAGNKDKRPEFAAKSVTIEDDVWIGFNVTILKGVTIGRGAIIQPGAVVSRSVPPGTVMQGNPAQPVNNLI